MLFRRGKRPPDMLANGMQRARPTFVWLNTMEVSQIKVVQADELRRHVQFMERFNRCWDQDVSLPPNSAFLDAPLPREGKRRPQGKDCARRFYSVINNRWEVGASVNAVKIEEKVQSEFVEFALDRLSSPPLGSRVRDEDVHHCPRSSQPPLFPPVSGRDQGQPSFSAAIAWPFPGSASSADNERRRRWKDPALHRRTNGRGELPKPVTAIGFDVEVGAAVHWAQSVGGPGMMNRRVRKLTNARRMQRNPARRPIARDQLR
jgi:hypothetical protein